MENIIGIQQMGIGIPNVHEAFKWYRQAFGSDIQVFEEAAEANLMLPYTGGKPHQRHAILAVNMRSGGGFEIWQYTSRTPEPPAFKLNLGDLGFFICKIKCVDVLKAYEQMKSKELNLLSDVVKDPAGLPHFFVKDPYNNIFQVVKGEGWFVETKSLTGGVYGSIIGVSNMEKSIAFYSNVLGYDTVIYDDEGVFDDLKGLPSGDHKVRRVLLKHSLHRTGGFSKLLGPTQIELIQVAGRTPKKIFENRFWGDQGFIHLCFDVRGMSEVKVHCEKHGAPFTIDSGEHFDMGEAAGHFAYIEDPDGALIEFVETHKVPLLKKFGWYLDMRKRDPKKNLPNWMLKAMAFNRVKD